jgi:30S ribosomal protein S31
MPALSIPESRHTTNTMGKGDRKTRRGKIWRGTFGKRRPRARNEKPAAKPATAK